MGEILAYISKEDANVSAEVCQPYAPMLGTSVYCMLDRVIQLFAFKFS
jgi:hypothetical protein